MNHGVSSERYRLRVVGLSGTVGGGPEAPWDTGWRHGRGWYHRIDPGDEEMISIAEMHRNPLAIFFVSPTDGAEIEGHRAKVGPGKIVTARVRLTGGEGGQPIAEHDVMLNFRDDEFDASLGSNLLA